MFIKRKLELNQGVKPANRSYIIQVCQWINTNFNEIQIKTCRTNFPAYFGRRMLISFYLLPCRLLLNNLQRWKGRSSNKFKFSIYSFRYLWSLSVHPTSPLPNKFVYFLSLFPQTRESDRVTEMLKLCLQKICELQADLENEENMRDPEAAGYTACALETLRFLSDHGLPPDHPMVKEIAEKLLRDRDWFWNLQDHPWWTKICKKSSKSATILNE